MQTWASSKVLTLACWINFVYFLDANWQLQVPMCMEPVNYISRDSQMPFNLIMWMPSRSVKYIMLFLNDVCNLHCVIIIRTNHCLLHWCKLRINLLVQYFQPHQLLWRLHLCQSPSQNSSLPLIGMNLLEGLIFTSSASLALIVSVGAWITSKD